jgi:hypothetical protein
MAEDMWNTEISLQLKRFGDSAELSCKVDKTFAVVNYESSLPRQAIGLESW